MILDKCLHLLGGFVVNIYFLQWYPTNNKYCWIVPLIVSVCAGVVVELFEVALQIGVADPYDIVATILGGVVFMVLYGRY